MIKKAQDSTKSIRGSLLIVAILCGLTFCMKAETINAMDTDKTAKYPSNPIKIIIPGSGGGVNHRGVMIIAPFLEKYLGARLVIENVPGADGIIAYNKSFKDRADGYSLLSINFLSPVVLELTRKTGYVSKQFCYVGGWNANNFIIGVHPDNWKTFPEFLAAAKQKNLTLASQGGSADMQGHLIEEGLGIKFRWIPYNSGQEAQSAVAGKHVDVVLTFSAPAMSMVKGGILNAIAVLADKRDPILPGVPTLRELGHESVTRLDISGGFAAPPKTPVEIISILEGKLKKVCEDSEFIKLAERSGIMVNFQPAAKVNKLILDYHAILNKYKDALK